MIILYVSDFIVTTTEMVAHIWKLVFKSMNKSMMFDMHMRIAASHRSPFGGVRCFVVEYHIPLLVIMYICVSIYVIRHLMSFY